MRAAWSKVYVDSRKTGCGRTGDGSINRPCIPKILVRILPGNDNRQGFWPEFEVDGFRCGKKVPVCLEKGQSFLVYFQFFNGEGFHIGAFLQFSLQGKPDQPGAGPPGEGVKEE